MIRPAINSLHDVIRQAAFDRVDWTTGYLQQLEVAVNRFEAAGFSSRLVELTPEAIVGFMRSLRDSGRTARTANNYRASLLALWREAHRRGLIGECPEVRKMKEPQRMPRAWRPDDLTRLIAACRSWKAPRRWSTARRQWTAAHWEALVRTVLETSLRIRTTLTLRTRDFDRERREITGPGETQKQRRDTVNRVSETTANLLDRLERPDDRLFPWPFRDETLWRNFRRILESAGLPATSRDQFHKLRRTSYSYVYREFGLAAASEHAGHATDMSRYYLDRTLLDKPDALSAIPLF